MEDNINIHRKFETPGNFGSPKGVLKINFFSRDLALSKFQICNLEISSFEKTTCVPLASFCMKVRND